MAEDILFELNRDFYEHSPSQYIRTRVALLLALGDESRPMHRALEGGLAAWDVSVKTPVAYDREETDEFAIVESISLMYLAAEVLLRLFLAHRDGNSCPPLALASMTDFRAFKKQLSALLESPPSLNEVHRLFRGSTEPTGDIGAQVWLEDGETLQFLLARAADLLVNQAHVYNSIKHGLAAQPRNSSFQMSDAEDPERTIIDHSGNSIRFLSRKWGRDKDVDDWSETIEFVFPSTNLAFTAAFADSVDALHSVGRGRLYGGTAQFVLRGKDFIDSVMKVPFRANYTGLMKLSMVRTFSVRSQDPNG